MWLPGKWEESSSQTLAGNLGIETLAKTSPLGAVVCGTRPLWVHVHPAALRHSNSTQPM